jgi:hypothetical protein
MGVMSSLAVNALTSTRLETAAERRQLFQRVSTRLARGRQVRRTPLNVERERRVERLGEDLLDRAAHLDLEDLDAERQVLERQPEHLWQRVVLHLSVMPELSKQVECEALLDATGPAPALGGVALRNPSLDELRNLSLLVKPAARKGKVNVSSATL